MGEFSRNEEYICPNEKLQKKEKKGRRERGNAARGTERNKYRVFENEPIKTGRRM